MATIIGDTPPSFASATPPDDDDSRIVDVDKGKSSSGPKFKRTTSNRTKASIKKSGPTTKQLEDALAELLTMPSLPFMMAGDQFCSDHFMTAGPELAKKLAETSEHNEPLRRILERVIVGESVAVLFFGIVTYALPPLLHHRVIPGSEAIAPMFGVPIPHVEHSVEPDGSPDRATHPNTHKVAG